MGYATNRYFQPAKYTPIITEVDMPFKELFAAGKARQEYEDAAGATSTKAGEQGNILQMVSTSDGQVLRNAHAEKFAEQDASLQQDAYNFSKSIAGQEKSSPEMQAALQDIDYRYNAVYGPNGERATHQQADKDYNTLRKNISETPGVTEHPWDALEGDLSIINYATGKTNYIDPYAVNKNIHVNWNEAADKIVSGINEIGEAWANPDGTYISHGSRVQITPEKILGSFREGFHGSDLQNDLWRKREYNVRVKHMDEKTADKIYADDVSAMEKYVVKKYTKQLETAGLSADPTVDYGAMKQAQRDRANENQQTVVTKNPKAANAVQILNTLQDIYTGKLKFGDSEYMNVLNQARSFMTPESQKKLNSMGGNPYENTLNAYKNAIVNTAQRTIEHGAWTNDVTQKNRTANIMRNAEERSVVIIGENGILSTLSDKVFDANDLIKKTGLRFKTFKELLNSANALGTAKTDQYGLGAGSTVMTIYSPILKRQVQIVVSPDKKQEKTYEMSTHLNEPLLDPTQKRAYYIPKIDASFKNGIDFSSGTKVDKGTKPTDEAIYGPVPMYIESESFIRNAGTGQETFGIRYKTMVRDKKTGEYKEDPSLNFTPESLYNDEDEFYSNEINVAANQNKRR